MANFLSSRDSTSETEDAKDVEGLGTNESAAVIATIARYHSWTGANYLRVARAPDRYFYDEFERLGYKHFRTKVSEGTLWNNNDKMLFRFSVQDRATANLQEIIDASLGLMAKTCKESSAGQRQLADRRLGYARLPQSMSVGRAAVSLQASLVRSGHDASSFKASKFGFSVSLTPRPVGLTIPDIIHG